MQISTTMVKTLREETGAGIIDCRNALVEALGDVEKARGILRERGLAKAERKAGRIALQGLIETYVHPGGRLGAIIEVNCETDFVARTSEFKELAHNLVLQIAATAPQFISKEELSPGANLDSKEVCLLHQLFIKDPQKTVQDIITATIAKVGENITVRRFARFELGG